MHDPFIGTWKLNPARSAFDPNHRPTEGTMRLKREDNGAYLLEAEGRNEKGEPCTERPQRLLPDGRPYPVPDFPGLNALTSRPHPSVLHARVTREDGSVAGEGTYEVAPDGQTLTATTAGFDTQLRRFETKTVWDRV
jgi:hypothetical protein